MYKIENNAVVNATTKNVVVNVDDNKDAIKIMDALNELEGVKGALTGFDEIGVCCDWAKSNGTASPAMAFSSWLTIATIVSTIRTTSANTRIASPFAS